jgi:xylose isomerase
MEEINMSQFKYSVGPWNVSEGSDAFGPEVRKSIALEKKIEKFRQIGFDAVQFHDDDAVPDMNNLSQSEILAQAGKVRKMLDNFGLAAEFVAPRLWMDPRTADGGFTSSSPADREFAMWRAFRSIDIANVLGADKIVLWLAREGTLCAESKSAVEGIKRLVESINKMLEYDKNIKVLIEPKPNEPIDRSFCGTIGHVMGVSAATADPTRVGGLLESAHAILAGLDPANEISFGLAFGKLWGVHLNDQNGMKYDQDKAFGVENLRQAFNQIKVLMENNYGSHGEYIGLDVKAMRTQRDDACYQHLINSLKIAKYLEMKAAQFDYAFQAKCVAERNFEKLELYVMELLMGVPTTKA